MAQIGLRLFEAVCEHAVGPLLPDVVAENLILIILNTTFYMQFYHIQIVYIIPTCQDLFGTEVWFPICYVLFPVFWNLIFMLCFYWQKKKCWKIRWETVFGKILLAIPFQLVINPAFWDNFNQLAMDHLSQYAGYRFYSSLMANDHAAWAMSLPPFLSNPHPF